MYTCRVQGHGCRDDGSLNLQPYEQHTLNPQIPEGGMASPATKQCPGERFCRSDRSLHKQEDTSRFREPCVWEQAPCSGCLTLSARYAEPVLSE